MHKEVLALAIMTLFLLPTLAFALTWNIPIEKIPPDFPKDGYVCTPYPIKLPIFGIQIGERYLCSLKPGYCLASDDCIAWGMKGARCVNYRCLVVEQPVQPPEQPPTTTPPIQPPVEQPVCYSTEVEVRIGRSIYCVHQTVADILVNLLSFFKDNLVRIPGIVKPM